MTAQVAADLRAAAEVLRRDGWRQGDYGSVNGCKCTYGALHYIGSDGRDVDDFGPRMTTDDIRRADEAGAFLAEHLELPGYSYIPNWNDAPGRTADEVIAALEDAADAAEASDD